MGVKHYIALVSKVKGRVWLGFFYPQQDFHFETRELKDWRTANGRVFHWRISWILMVVCMCASARTL